ncbi:MAG TPA: hypothetical protein VNO19_02615 [Gemmatimonadales bacterium]|nr:hypothetical protein [Gemmatimonadales bacterium]
MSLHSTLLANWLLLGVLMVPPPAIAQAPAPDTTARAAADSQPVNPDSAVAADSVPGSRDSTTASRDSLRSPQDSVRPPGTGRAAAPGTAPPRAEPVDSILSAACRGPAGGRTVAPDLLVIVFGPEAGVQERAAAAKSVQGTLLGAVTGEPGAYYLGMPSGGGEYDLRAAADQLIQRSKVRQVGSRACPRPPPAQASEKPL